MKLYFSPGACSLTVRIIINEIDLQAEYEEVDLKTKKTHNGADFLTINPRGAVPTLRTDNDVILTQNLAIIIYLAEEHQRHDLFPSRDHIEHYRVLEWLSFMSSDLHKAIGHFFNKEVNAEDNKNIFMPIVLKRLGFVESQLTNKLYLLGNTFTLPDAYLFVLLRWAIHFQFVNAEKFPQLMRYFADLHKRPSIEKSLTEEKL